MAERNSLASEWTSFGVRALAARMTGRQARPGACMPGRSWLRGSTPTCCQGDGDESPPIRKSATCPGDWLQPAATDCDRLKRAAHTERCLQTVHIHLRVFQRPARTALEQEERTDRCANTYTGAVEGAATAAAPGHARFSRCPGIRQGSEPAWQIALSVSGGRHLP